MSLSSCRRSPVPDLLFEDVRESRIHDLVPLLEAPENIDEANDLHRVTVFLTYRCNLRCPYCKTIARNHRDLETRPEKAITYSLEEFSAALDGIGGATIRHLHFTGGEPSILPVIPEMIVHAKERGIKHISMTSNGTMPPERYLQCVESGLDEIRISIDASDPGMGEAMTEKRDAWFRAVATIKTLSAERDRIEGRLKDREFFIILNTVVTELNRREIDKIVEFLIELDPDDIKLITSVDGKNSLADFSGESAVTAALHRITDAQSQKSFPLLRKKLRTVFSPESIGWDSGSSDASPPFSRCYIPLTERTIDGKFYYPCSVYLREAGRPLGEISDSAEIQRKKSAAFVRQGCGDDPICKKYCLNCTREYNRRLDETRTYS